MFWGALIALTSIGQYVLFKSEFYEINWYPYLLMPVGGIYSWVYFSRKKKSSPNQISRIISCAWIVLSLNMMLLGFLFWPSLKENLIPVLLILLSIGIIISGVSVQSKILLLSGLLINVSAFICFKIEQAFQPLMMGIVAIVAVLIPGILLMIKQKRKN
ncbi:MAG: hypothetical protein ACK5HT_06445 [Draconibacterium sp.]